MPECMLMFAPHLNSYHRFQDGSHAPVYACWGYENRTTAVRVPESEPVARRIEHRVSGADANPYLVLAAVLTGALHGIENQLQAPPDVEGDAYAIADQSIRLPSSWRMAIDRLEKAGAVRHYLGDEFVDVFCAVKRHEHSLLNKRISDIEYESYLGLL